MRLRFELYMSSSFPPHCLQGLQQCCALEEAMLGVEQKIGIGPCFPVTVGRRPDKTHKCGAREDRAARNGPSAVGRYERVPLVRCMWPVGCDCIPLCDLVDAQSVNHLLITYSSLSPSPRLSSSSSAWLPSQSTASNPPALLSVTVYRSAQH